MKHSNRSFLRPSMIAASCALFALAALAAQPAAAQAVATKVSYKRPAHADDSLYRALGGQAGVTRLADDFVPRLVADRRIGEFFKHTNQQHLKEMLAQQFCQVSGGGCAYTGIPMKTAHQDMDIAKGDFNALVELLQFSMEDQGIPFSTQNRLLARLAPMHRDIVNVH
jgi:hemoglobin